MARPEKPEVLRVFDEMELVGEEIHLKLGKGKEIGEQMYYTDMGDAKKGMICTPMTCTKIESIENFKSFQIKSVLHDNSALANEVKVKVKRS
ncbi:MAG: hypothetical protein QNJ97_05090 [Myxococcota bacterium]|nr:hypothetical protein [Myxococcota bacterium]